MASRNHCDGTGVEIPDDTPTTGFFGRQYSDEARLIAEEYLKKVDELHFEIATKFQAALDALRAEYRTRIQTLPDDPT